MTTDAEYMANPMEWPQWPLCPLKRCNERGQPMEFAYLFADGKPIIRFGNIFDAHPNTDRTQVYASFAAIAADGWKVD